MTAFGNARSKRANAESGSHLNKLGKDVVSTANTIESSGLSRHLFLLLIIVMVASGRCIGDSEDPALFGRV